MTIPALTRQMIDAARGVQAAVTIVPDFKAACRYAADITAEQGGRSIAAPALKEAEQKLLADMCRGRLQVLQPPLRRYAGEMYTGVTWADRGIADTGTLVIDSASEDLRLATMLCEIHVALLPESAICPDMKSAAVFFDQTLKSPPGYLAFITGASRTADIERVLTIGVHGPRELHLLILQEDRP